MTSPGTLKHFSIRLNSSWPGLRNTTLSVKAAGQVTIRLAPGQDFHTIGSTAEELMRGAAPDGAELDIRWDGAPPGLGDDEGASRQRPRSYRRSVDARCRPSSARPGRKPRVGRAQRDDSAAWSCATIAP